MFIAKQHQRLLSYIKQEKQSIHQYYNMGMKFHYHSNYEKHSVFQGMSLEQEYELYEIISYKSECLKRKVYYYYAFMEYFSLPFFTIRHNWKLFQQDLQAQNPKTDSFEIYLKKRDYIKLPWARFKSNPKAQHHKGYYRLSLLEQRAVVLEPPKRDRGF